MATLKENGGITLWGEAATYSFNDREYSNAWNNYIYISHLDNIKLNTGASTSNQDFRYWILPFYPQTITDSMSSTFQSASALGRSAPVWAYSESGPRTVQFSMTLNRDMMTGANIGNMTVTPKLGEDYMDNLIAALQAISVPRYNLDNKVVEPPIVALRIGNQLFIKGIVNGPIGITYSGPILTGDVYAQAELSLTITEIDPYDAETVFKNGSFRGWVRAFQNGFISPNDTGSYSFSEITRGAN